MGELKSLTAREILSTWKEKDYKILSRLKIVRDGFGRFAFWQRRYYDHNCRTQESVLEKINYCHSNPVRSGFTATPGEWRWSSYRWYNGQAGVVIEVDGVEM